jgi:DNA helicase-2/ATP-dependent DNA helicase PcrA
VGIRQEQIEEAGDVQRRAAADGNDHVRLIAGPGTGKSFTIEERVCWLLDQGVDRRRIAAVSFTRASAFDLQRRVRAACERAGHPDAEISVTTLHSLALRSLRAGGILAAYPVDPLVLDQWELKNLFDEEFGRVAGIGSTPRRREIREDHEAFWSTGRRDLRPSQRPPEPPISDAERQRFRQFHTGRTQLYACVLPGELVQRCVQLMDAGTLDPVELLGIDHVIVDEFQDLNPMDLRFVYGMEAVGVTLFVAGDDDQSLYSFRYANPEGIQQFTERFEDAGDHVLQHCFRCTPKVLNAADTLITEFAAPGRIAKNLVSLYGDADPPVEGGFGCWRFRDGSDEARAIAASCRRLIDAGLSPREIMVLVNNAQALGWQLREAFEESAVPFEPPRVAPFKNTPPGRAVLTALRLVTREDDYVALRALLKLRRGVGVGTAAAIADTAILEDLNYRDLFYEPLPDDVFSSRAETALIAARAVCEELVEWGVEETVGDRAEDLDRIIEMILGQAPDADWRDELEGLPQEATLEEMARYLSSEKDDEQAAMLVAVYARLGQAIEPEEALPERVRVMTMHGAKGLSATVVFIPAMEEQMLPGDRRARFPGQVLEAARMLYVSITRARLACVVSYSTSRFINGQSTRHAASRYTAQLGETFRPGGGGITEALADQIVEAAEYL